MRQPIIVESGNVKIILHDFTCEEQRKRVLDAATHIAYAALVEQVSRKQNNI